jgi:ArsR family transcriptional regulator
MRDVVTIVKALADENRLRALLALRNRELCVCQIIELLGLAPSTVSKHMSILRQARLVEGRKAGKWMYYRLAGKEASPAVRSALAWARASLSGDRRIRADAKRVENIHRQEPEACKK